MCQTGGRHYIYYLQEINSHYFAFIFDMFYLESYYEVTFGEISGCSCPRNVRRRELDGMVVQQQDAAYCESLINMLEEMESWESVQNALNKALPNNSDETDYEEWSEGAKRFDDTNKDLLMELMK